MPRPRSIPYEKRVTIFLHHRRLKKVYPVAKRYGVARSTVSLIVREFQEMGFAPAPRADLSPRLLVQIQEHHLQEVVQELQKPRDLALVEPGGNVRALLEPEEALGEGAASDLEAKRDPLPLTESLIWHLKGMEAERMVEDVKRGIRAYDRRCLQLWLDIRSGLEEACKLPVRLWRRAEAVKQPPGLLVGLVDVIYRQLFAPGGWIMRPPSEWPAWVSPENDPEILQLSGQAYSLASGSPEALERVKQGVKAFVDGNLTRLRHVAAELAHLYHDLQYVKPIVEGALSSVTEEEVRRGICPACPYPEAREESGSGS